MIAGAGRIEPINPKPNATVDGVPFHSSAIAAERQREDERLAYIFHGERRA